MVSWMGLEHYWKTSPVFVFDICISALHTEPEFTQTPSVNFNCHHFFSQKNVIFMGKHKRKTKWAERERRGPEHVNEASYE